MKYLSLKAPFNFKKVQFSTFDTDILNEQATVWATNSKKKIEIIFTFKETKWF
jgi:hypothetical protein